MRAPIYSNWGFCAGILLGLCVGLSCARTDRANVAPPEMAGAAPGPVNGVRPGDPELGGESHEAGSQLAVGQELSKGAGINPAVVEREPLAGAGARFVAAGVDGAFIVRQRGRADRVYGDRRVDERRQPCSTFKLANALIALEEGVVSGVDMSLPWDGVERWLAPWNRDHDLRSAMKFSVVWYFQELARRIGEPAMERWLGVLEYGDRRIGDSVDSFWLEGPLSISAAEELEFVDRLVDGSLPVSERSLSLVRSIVPGRTYGRASIRAKTGTCVYEDGRTPHAWLVGWVERDGAPIGSFALLLVKGANVNALVDVRWSLAARLLADAGLLDASALAAAG